MIRRPFGEIDLGERQLEHEVMYVVQRKVGDEDWEGVKSWGKHGEEKAKDTLNDLKSSLYDQMSGLFYNISSPKEARAAAEIYEDLEKTEYRLIRRVTTGTVRETELY